MPHYHRPLPVGHADVSWRMRLTGDPDPMYCTMSFDLPTAPDLATVNALHTAWGTRLMPRLTNAYTLETTHCLYQSDSVNQVAIDSSGAAVAGTYAGTTTVLPPNSCWLIRKKTTFAGRRNRGRMFVPCVVETDVDHVGALLSAVVTAHQAAANLFFSDIAGHGPELVHSVLCTAGDAGHGGAHSAIPQPPNPLSNLEVDDRIATIRRRMNR